MDVVIFLPILFVFFFILFNCFALRCGLVGDSEESSPTDCEMFVPLGDIISSFPATIFSLAALLYSVLFEVDDAHICCPFNWR